MTRNDLSTKRHYRALSVNDCVFWTIWRESKHRANDLTIIGRKTMRDWRLCETGSTSRNTCYRLRDKNRASRFCCTLVSAFVESRLIRNLAWTSPWQEKWESARGENLAWLSGVKDLVCAISKQSDFSLAHIEIQAKPRKLVCGHEIRAHSGQARKLTLLSDWFDSTDAEIRVECDWEAWRKSW